MLKAIFISAFLLSNAAIADTSPYETFKSLFDQSDAMPLSVLPEANASDLSTWKCVGANKSTTNDDLIEQIADGPYAPVIVKGRGTDYSVFYLKNNGSETPTIDEVSEEMQTMSQKISTENGLQISLQLADNGMAPVIATFRYQQQGSKKQVTVHYDGAERVAFLYSYMYCTNQ